jgi:hypothetical protein
MEGAGPGTGRRRGRTITLLAAAAVAVLAVAGAAVLVLPTRPGRIPVHVLPVGQNINSATAIAVDGPHVWVANEGDGDGRGGSVTELDAGDGGWVRTLSGARYGFNAPYSIASAHGRIWVTNLYPGVDGGSVTELNAGDGSWVATLTGGCYSFDSPHGIAVDGSHIWVANSGASQAGGSVTELNASNGRWIQTLSDGTWIQSLLRGCIPGVLASGGYHFSDPGLVAAVGPRIWVFGRDGVRVLTDPAARPGRGERP